MTLRTIVGGGINWTWYLQGEFDEVTKTVRILYHTRFHNERDAHPVAEPGYRDFHITESKDNERIALEVTVGQTTYRVLNPLCVFNYHDFSQIGERK